MKGNRIIYIVSVVILIAIVTWSCERDDICAAATPTTPRLIITFYDINDPDQLKTVRQLEIIGLDDDGNPLDDRLPILSRTTTDSINLPLRFQEENVETISRFKLSLNADLEDDDDETTNSNPDIITITYTPEFIYVSRACGYKSIFNLGDAPYFRDGEAQGDEDTWTKSFEIINQTIENENQAHIIIYH